MLRRIELWLLITCALLRCVRGADDELLMIHQGDLPIVISAPHGGSLSIPDVPPRKGEGLESGASGFRVARDGGTEELALAVAKAIDDRLEGSPTWVISRVHRRYVDFNRPAAIGVEHPQALVLHDQYHSAIKDAIRGIRERQSSGLLVDLHGQGSSATTVYRGTGNGQTVSGLRERTQELGHTGPDSLTGLLKNRGWIVHPDPFDAKEQAGFAGGHIVRSSGSHRADGIDAIQLELGANYRKADSREQMATELADAIVEFAEKHITEGIHRTPTNTSSADSTTPPPPVAVDSRP